MATANPGERRQVSRAGAAPETGGLAVGEQTLAQSTGTAGCDAAADVDHRLGDAEAWQQWLTGEADRFNRYERPSTVVSMILVGIDELTRWFGEEIVRDYVEGLLAEVVHGTRDSDLIAPP